MTKGELEHATKAVARASELLVTVQECDRIEAAVRIKKVWSLTVTGDRIATDFASRIVLAGVASVRKAAEDEIAALDLLPPEGIPSRRPDNPNEDVG